MVTGSDDERERTAAFIARYPCMPSVAGVQYMRNRLQLAYAGQKLISYTAQTTGNELRGLAKEIVDSYECFREDMCLSFMLLARARYDNPCLNHIVLNNVPSEANVKVKLCTKIISGVEVLQLRCNVGLTEHYAHLGIGRGGESARAAKRHWQNMIKKMTQMCQQRITFEHLDRANRSAAKQTTMLSERLIPGINSNITAREDELEERKRDQLYRMKILAHKLKTSEHGSKGELKDSPSSANQNIANRREHSCHPECPFECPKMDPTSMTKNYILNIKDHQLRPAGTESANREKLSNEDISGCPITCIKMYEKMLLEETPDETEDKNTISKATSPITICGPKKKTENKQTSVKPTSLAKYDPGPDFMKCTLCRDAKEKQKERESKKEQKTEEADKVMFNEEEEAKLKKQEEEDEMEDRRRIEETEVELKKKQEELLRNMSGLADNTEEKKKNMSTSQIEELLPCPHFHKGVSERTKPPPCPKVHAAMVETDSILYKQHDNMRSNIDTKSSLKIGLKLLNENPRFADAQEETGVAVQSSFHRLEVNHTCSLNTFSPDGPFVRESESNENVHFKSVSTETNFMQLCSEHKENHRVLISNATSVDEMLSPCPLCHVICPKVDPIPCPHCHKTYSKENNEDEDIKVCSKTTSPLENGLQSICSHCHTNYYKKKKYFKPCCFSASTQKFYVLSGMQHQTSHPKMEQDKNEIEVVDKVIENSSKTSAKNKFVSGCDPTCTGRKLNSLIVDSKEKKPIICSETNGPEIEKGLPKEEIKDEKPILCSKTTSIAKELPTIPEPVDDKMNKSSSKEEKLDEKPIHCSKKRMIVKKSPPNQIDPEIKKESVHDENKDEKPITCSKTTSIVKEIPPVSDPIDSNIKKESCTEADKDETQISSLKTTSIATELPLVSDPTDPEIKNEYSKEENRNEKQISCSKITPIANDVPPVSDSASPDMEKEFTKEVKPIRCPKATAVAKQLQFGCHPSCLGIKKKFSQENQDEKSKPCSKITSIEKQMLPDSGPNRIELKKDFLKEENEDKEPPCFSKTKSTIKQLPGGSGSVYPKIKMSFTKRESQAKNLINCSKTTSPIKQPISEPVCPEIKISPTDENTTTSVAKQMTPVIDPVCPAKKEISSRMEYKEDKLICFSESTSLENRSFDCDPTCTGKKQSSPGNIYEEGGAVCTKTTSPSLLLPDCDPICTEKKRKSLENKFRNDKPICCTKAPSPPPSFNRGPICTEKNKSSLAEMNEEKKPMGSRKTTLEQPCPNHNPICTEKKKSSLADILEEDKPVSCAKTTSPVKKPSLDHDQICDEKKKKSLVEIFKEDTSCCIKPTSLSKRDTTFIENKNESEKRKGILMEKLAEQKPTCCTKATSIDKLPSLIPAANTKEEKQNGCTKTTSTLRQPPLDHDPICSERKKSVPAKTPKEEQPISCTKTMSTMKQPALEHGPLCNEKKESVLAEKLKAEKPICCTKRTSTLKKPSLDHDPICSEGKESIPAEKPKKEQLISCSKTTSTMKQPALEHGPLCNEKKESVLAEKPICCTKRTSTLKKSSLDHDPIRSEKKESIPAEKPKEEQPISCTKTTSTMKQPLLDRGQLCNEKKEGEEKPICCTKIASPPKQPPIDHDVICSERKESVLAYTPKKEKPISCTKTTSTTKQSPIDHGPLCNDNRESGLVEKPKKEKPICCTKRISALKQPPLGHDPLCIEKKEKVLAAKFKDEKPICCTKTTSTVKQLPIDHDPICNEKKENVLMEEPKKEKLICCTKRTSALKQLPFSHDPLCIEKKERVLVDMPKKKAPICCTKTTSTEKQSPLDPICNENKESTLTETPKEEVKKLPLDHDLVCIEKKENSLIEILKTEENSCCTKTISPPNLLHECDPTFIEKKNSITEEKINEEEPDCCIKTLPTKQPSPDPETVSTKEEESSPNVEIEPFCAKKEKPPCATSTNEIPCVKYEKRASLKSKFLALTRCQCQDTEDIETPVAADPCEMECKKNEQLGSIEPERRIELEDLTIDEKGNVVIRKNLREKAQRDKLISIKDVIERGEEEFRKVRRLRDALKIPCTNSIPCTKGCIYKKATQISVGQTTSNVFPNSEKTYVSQRVSASFHSVVMHTYKDKILDPVSSLKLEKRKIDGACDTKRDKLIERLTQASFISQEAKSNQVSIKNVETSESKCRPVSASVGILDLRSVATSIGDHVENISEEELEKIHVYLSQSPACTDFKKIHHRDNANDSYEGNDISIEGVNHSYVHNGNYVDSNNSYMDNVDSNKDNNVNEALDKKNPMKNAKDKLTKMLRNSFNRARAQPKLKDSVQQCSNKSLYIIGHKLKLF